MADYVTRHRDIEISISDEFAMLQARVAECVEVVVDALALARHY
jgi:hypothetical protein